MIKLELTQRSFDTILVALWHAKIMAQGAAAPGGFSSPAVVDLTNLMANIVNQRDRQVAAEAINEYVQAGR
jgi:hypothetical protein